MAFLSKESNSFISEILPQNITYYVRSTIEDLVEILENRTNLSIKTLIEYYDKQSISSYFGWRPFIPVASATVIKDHKKYNKFDDPEINKLCDNLIIPIETSGWSDDFALPIFFIVIINLVFGHQRSNSDFINMIKIALHSWDNYIK